MLHRRLLALGAAILIHLAGCASDPPRGTVHTLRAGETIYRLSRYYGVSAESIIRANRIRDVSDVPVGTRLMVEVYLGYAKVAGLFPSNPDAPEGMEGSLVRDLRARKSNRQGQPGRAARTVRAALSTGIFRPSAGICQ